MRSTRISLITIGSELLKGTIINTNAARAGTLLRDAGYQLHRVVTIGDQAEAIGQAVAEEMAHSEVVLMSGGLGPTQDDITKQTLSDIFGAQQMQLHEPTLAHLEQRYRHRGRALNDRTRAQALVPDVCEVVPNEQGTAPGMLFRREDRFLIALPGVPFEMLGMLQKEVIPLLQREKPSEVFLRAFIRLYRVPESEAAQRMADLEAAEPLPPEIEVAYLPRADGLWLEVSAQAPPREAEQRHEQVERTAERIFRQFQAEAYTRTPDDLASIVQKTFIEKRLTLAVAESMTGGAVAAKLVSISGASNFFKGSVTAYFTQIKTHMLGVPQETIAERGVVSAEVARAMATGVRERLQADVGLAITGRAEADGEAAAEAWLAYADAQGTEAEHVDFIYRRQTNIKRATHQLLLLGLEKVRQRF